MSMLSLARYTSGMLVVLKVIKLACVGQDYGIQSTIEDNTHESCTD